MALNPNDPEFLNEYGIRLAQSGNWQEGCALARKSRENKPIPTAYQDTGLALCAYFGGDLTTAVSLIGTMSSHSYPLALLVAAVIYAEAGDTRNFALIHDLLKQTAPAMLENPRTEIEAGWPGKKT